jgi:hypothetical protein
MSKPPKTEVNKNGNKKAKNIKLAGLYDVDDIVLAWEDPDHFLEFYDECRGEYQPEGLPQEIIVAEIVRLQWEKRRLNSGSQSSHYRNLNPHQFAEARKEGPQAVRTFIDSLSGTSQTMTVVNAHFDAQKKIIRHVAEMSEEAMQAEDPEKQAIAFQQVDQLCLMAKALCEMSERSTVPILREFQKEESEIEWSSRPELILRKAKTHAELDRQIQKHFQHLVQQKEFRRLYRNEDAQPVIDVTPSRISSRDNGTERLET